MEAAHTPASLAAAARHAASELLRSGTTTVLTMETVHDTDAVFEALEPMGLRAVVGKCMMDADPAVPARLMERTARIDRRERCAGETLARPGQRPAPRRVRTALCRVVLSRIARGCCGTGTGASARRPHACVRESRRDCAGQVADRPEEHRLPCRHRPDHATPMPGALRVGRRRRAGVDGRARREGAALPRLEPQARIRPRAGRRNARAGISVSLGADGAACNNHLDMFEEMRLAAVLQSVRHQPGALTARDVVPMATREGARALGLEHNRQHRGRQAGRPDPRSTRRDPTRTRPSSTPAAARMSGRPSSMARCWSTISGPPVGSGRDSARRAPKPPPSPAGQTFSEWCPPSAGSTANFFQPASSTMSRHDISCRAI